MPVGNTRESWKVLCAFCVVLCAFLCYSKYKLDIYFSDVFACNVMKSQNVSWTRFKLPDASKSDKVDYNKCE